METPQSPLVYSFLGDTVATALVARVTNGAHMDSVAQISFAPVLFSSVRLRLDELVLNNLGDDAVAQLVDLKENNTSQKEVDAFLRKNIPDFDTKVNDILEQIYQEQKIKLNF
ncbi:MAG: hypothetical protein A2V81_02455 [Candidatus Abawacabacteria bacterium RBG_16_42_10]|uniref:Uncharacterized protein n=1 Tax=Candidatus Abawacabacteria bacterium RBG_16_42_10 TaxID=1817814 RepID=A0A1F4XL99_9BACT|nr:MAG: hypothetical protein A2V81_02455 [Candidatus Abawacabacteria bacterium RBG_16_42_10]